MEIKFNALDHGRKASESKEARKCNLCGVEIPAAATFIRFCETCRQNSEILHSEEWLPEYEVQTEYRDVA